MATKAKQSEVKESKEKANTGDKNSSSSVSVSLRQKELTLELAMNEIFDTRTASDRTTLKRVAEYVVFLAVKNSDEGYFDTVWKLAQRSIREGKNPIALFMSLMKSELEYNPVKEIRS